MLLAENNRLQIATPLMAKRIRARTKWLEKELKRVDAGLD
jgi:hypothetical protein